MRHYEIGHAPARVGLGDVDGARQPEMMFAVVWATSYSSAIRKDRVQCSYVRVLYSSGERLVLPVSLGKDVRVKAFIDANRVCRGTHRDALGEHER